MTTFNIDTETDVREFTAEELETVAGGMIVIGPYRAVRWLADATGGEAFFAYVNKLVRG